MNIYKLKDMTGGWFIGDFTPSLLKTAEIEVAVQYFKAGEHSPLHYHRVATEMTVIISGSAKINNGTVYAGDIVSVQPGESLSFHALEDTVTVVVKTPSIGNDKYLGHRGLTDE